MKNLDMVKVRLVPDYKLKSDTAIESAEAAVKLLEGELSQLDREAVCILNLNAKGKPINASIVSLGDMTGTYVHPREVFKCAVLSSAAGILILHNHPSDNVEPSVTDLSVTCQLISAGKIMGIRVIDHIIVGPNAEHYSMAANGLISSLEVSPVKQLDADKAELSNFKIRRVIEGNEENITLTREELSSAYFAQQGEFDREYIIETLEEIDANPKDAQIFKLKHDISARKVLSSESTIQKLTLEYRSLKNKLGADDSFVMEEVLEKGLADVPKRKKRSKEMER